MASAPMRNRPYLDRLRSLVRAYPPFKSFLDKVTHEDAGRHLVRQNFAGTAQQHPGRCYCLIFADDAVQQLDHDSHNETRGFESPNDLSAYLNAHPALASRASGTRRLFILEDMNPDYVDLLGEHLGVDPLVFSEQMNTWNYADSKSIPYRGLPSVSSPRESFTLRYYEIQTLEDPDSLDTFSFQMTFALNRRRYEKWRDVYLPKAGHLDEKHAFARRCASFWTSQDFAVGSPSSTIGSGLGADSPKTPSSDSGWDAVIMIDPGMVVPSPTGPSRLILKDTRLHKDRASLWIASGWDNKENVVAEKNESRPYHDGCPALAPLFFPYSSKQARRRFETFQQQDNLAAPLDEQVFYWTSIASKDLISAAYHDSCNTTYFLLKHIAQHWTNQLELINCTVAMAEWFSDDYQARVDERLDGRAWKSDLENVNNCTTDINYVRRQMNHFWRAMVLNLERLGVQLGSEQVDNKLPQVLSDAQRDFLTIHARMDPLRQRVANLAAMATDLASLRAAFKAARDSDFSLRLGIFASTVFPLTLIASMFSMADNFLPGGESFWVFWVSSVPLVALSGVLLRYGTGIGGLKRWMKKRKEIRDKERVVLQLDPDGDKWVV